LRLVHVVSSYYPRIGGVETHVRRLAEGCAEAGDHVTVLTHQVSGTPVEERVCGVWVRRFPLTVRSRHYPLSMGLFRYLKSHAADFDLVHTHSYHTLVGQAAVGSPLPWVFTPHYHGTGHTPFRVFLHRLYRPAGARQFRAADAVICVSDAERDLVIRDFSHVAGKIFTIPNGADSKLAAPDRGCIIPSQPVVLTVGRLERYKNIDLVIDAFRALPRPATLVVVGDGPDRARLERHVAATEPGWPIRFTGRISDSELGQLFAQASVVTSASDLEAFGITLVDGLASGAWIVASAIPAHVALARLVGADAPITLVDPRDTVQFKDSLAASLRADRIPSADLKLPSWADVIADTRELYAQVRWLGYQAYRKGT
jgi:glycosyltransferase involved in cell wall biosynthesis